MLRARFTAGPFIYNNPRSGDHRVIIFASVKTIALQFTPRSETVTAIKEQFGITSPEYVNREHTKLAKQLLADKRNNIANVSMQCGFADVNYFLRLFKK